MCWTPLYVNNTNNLNKTCTLLQTTGGKDESNIVFMQKLYAMDITARNSQKNKKMSNTDQP